MSEPGESPEIVDLNTIPYREADADRERIPLDYKELASGDVEVVLFGENHLHTALMDSIGQHAKDLKEAGVSAFVVEASSDQDFSDVNSGDFTRLDSGELTVGPTLATLIRPEYREKFEVFESSPLIKAMRTHDSIIQYNYTLLYGILHAKMKKVLLVKNITREGPGLLENLLKEHNIASDMVDLDKGDKFPDPLGYDAVFVFGGPDSANDETPKMKRELERIQQVLTGNIPYLGICLGLQTLVKVAGGKVVKNHVKEIGFRDPNNDPFSVTLTETVDLTEEGKRDPLFTNLGHTYHVFHLHGETVETTKHMTLLAVGKFCWNQIVRVGTNAYGIQSHFELTPEMFEQWINEDPDLQKMNKDALREDFTAIKDEYARVGRQLLTNFLKIAKLI